MLQVQNQQPKKIRSYETPKKEHRESKTMPMAINAIVVGDLDFATMA